MKILALDVGEKRVGLAISDELRIVASPTGFCEREQAIEKISDLVESEKVKKIVIGLPHLPSGDLGSQAKDILAFSEVLKESIDCRIDFEDESLSSVEAENRLKRRKKPYEKGEIDAEAAAIILENYLMRRND